jgi:hypothetical protein
MPAGFPPGIPGMGEDIDGAIQHAPQWVRQFIVKKITGCRELRVKKMSQAGNKMVR